MRLVGSKGKNIFDCYLTSQSMNDRVSECTPYTFICKYAIRHNRKEEEEEDIEELRSGASRNNGIHKYLSTQKFKRIIKNIHRIERSKYRVSHI